MALTANCQVAEREHLSLLDANKDITFVIARAGHVPRYTQSISQWQ